MNGLGARAPRPPPEFMLMPSGEELAVAAEDAEEEATEEDDEVEPEDDPCAEAGGSGRGCRVLLGGRIPLVLRMAALDRDLER